MVMALGLGLVAMVVANLPELLGPVGRVARTVVVAWLIVVLVAVVIGWVREVRAQAELDERLDRYLGPKE